MVVGVPPQQKQTTQATTAWTNKPASVMQAGSTTTTTPTQAKVAATAGAAGNAATTQAHTPTPAQPKPVLSYAAATKSGPATSSPTSSPTSSAHPTPATSTSTSTTHTAPAATTTAPPAQQATATQPATRTRSAWAQSVGFGATSATARTLGFDSIGTYGGVNAHLTLYRDDDRDLDVSLGFQQLLNGIVQQDTKAPMHLTLELYGKDSRWNPRAFGTGNGQAWARNVDEQAAAHLGRPGEVDGVRQDLRTEITRQVGLVRQALRPPFLASGGTKP